MIWGSVIGPSPIEPSGYRSIGPSLDRAIGDDPMTDRQTADNTPLKKLFRR